MNGIKLLLAGFALVSMEAGAANASSEGTQPVGVPVYTLHGRSNTLSCESAHINPAAVEVWKSVKASASSKTFDASCPVQAVAEGIIIRFHSLHRPAEGSITHGGGSFLYPGSATDFRADLRSLR